MKSIETRLEKLERREEKRPDPALDERRAYLHKLSMVPSAEAITEEWIELMSKGVAKDSPEMLDLQRRLDAVWRKHYGEEADGDESNSA